MPADTIDAEQLYPLCGCLRQVFSGLPSSTLQALLHIDVPLRPKFSVGRHADACIPSVKSISSSNVASLRASIPRVFIHIHIRFSSLLDECREVAYRWKISRHHPQRKPQRPLGVFRMIRDSEYVPVNISTGRRPQPFCGGSFCRALAWIDSLLTSGDKGRILESVLSSILSNATAEIQSLQHFGSLCFLWTR